MDPVSLHHCVLPALPNPLISETLDKLTPVMGREREQESKGVAGGAQIQH